jgi:membrane-associated protein
LGPKVFKSGNRILKIEYYTKTRDYFNKKGGNMLIISRFMPIFRTFAPFAAGMGNMNYKKYITFCVIGGIVWVSSLTLAGYFLGSYPWIQKNYEKVVFSIVGISILPILFGFLKSKFSKN